MPADLSHDRLGRRVLDLLDDMANWGLRKYVLGEVDVFKLDHTHELYGHMNVNYVQLDRVPAFQEGWKPVLDSLRAGKFFVTTGEVLIPSFTVDGQRQRFPARRSKAGPSREVASRAALDIPAPVRRGRLGRRRRRCYRQRIDLIGHRPVRRADSQA